MFDWLINFIQERFLNKSFKNIRMITSASLLFFQKKKKKTVSGNGKPVIFSQMRYYKSDSIASIQRRSLFSDLLETSIHYSSTSCLLPLC